MQDLSPTPATRQATWVSRRADLGVAARPGVLQLAADAEIGQLGLKPGRCKTKVFLRQPSKEGVGCPKGCWVPVLNVASLI